MDFGAEVDTALTAVEGAVLVVSAASGVETQTVAAFRKLREAGVRTILFVNKLDNPERRRPLPFIPRRIAMVTSESGAVIHDMCDVISRRFPNVEIRLWPATVKLAGTPQFDMQGGITWDTSRISEGLLFVKNIDTGIDSVISAETPRNIYDTRGRLVRANATNTEGLPAGIYVCEGRKFVVRP